MPKAELLSRAYGISQFWGLWGVGPYNSEAERRVPKGKPGVKGAGFLSIGIFPHGNVFFIKYSNATTSSSEHL